MTTYDYDFSFGGLSVKVSKLVNMKETDSIFMQGDEAADFLESLDTCNGDECEQSFLESFF